MGSGYRTPSTPFRPTTSIPRPPPARRTHPKRTTGSRSRTTPRPLSASEARAPNSPNSPNTPRSPDPGPRTPTDPIARATPTAPGASTTPKPLGPRITRRYASARIAVSKSRRARATRADCMPAASDRARSAVRSASARSPVRR